MHELRKSIPFSRCNSSFQAILVQSLLAVPVKSCPSSTVKHSLLASANTTANPLSASYNSDVAAMTAAVRPPRHLRPLAGVLLAARY
jgi:hypothetical protein